MFVEIQFRTLRLEKWIGYLFGLLCRKINVDRSKLLQKMDDIICFHMLVEAWSYAFRTLPYCFKYLGSCKVSTLYPA